MSWVAVGVGVGGAVVGYVGQQQTNNANARTAKNAGHVDMTTTRNPYGPASQYLDAGAQSAYDALYGTQNGPAIAGNPNAGGGGAGGGAGGGGGAQTRSNGPSTWVNAHGQTMTMVNGRAVPATGAAAAGGGGGGATGPASPSTVAGKSGQSAATSALIGRAANLPGTNAAMNGVAEQYSTDLLRGQSSNPLLDPATAASQNVGNDPRLSAFQDYLMNDLGVNGGGGGGGLTPTNFTGVYASNGQGGTATPAGYSSATGADAALRSLLAGHDPAGWAGYQQGITDDVNSSRADIIRQLRASAVGSGSYGGDIYNQQIGSAVAQGDRQLANQLASAKFGVYSNALGQGVQYDTSMADVAARDRATAASSASSASALAAQQRGQNLGALGSALQLGEEGRYGTAQGLGNLASLYSSDQKAALGGINDLAASRRNDLSAAGQLALGSDQTQNSRASAAMAANASRANTNAQIQWQQQQFYDPFTRLSDYTSILGGLYGGYGSQTEQGTDTRAGGGAAASSPWGAALSGAAIGGQLAGAYRQTPVTSGGGYGGPVANGVYG